MRSVPAWVGLLAVASAAAVAAVCQAESHGADERSATRIVAGNPPVKVIFETDFTFDVDDVGALAVLHALADKGEAEILGIGYNEAQPNAAAAIRAVNAWYGRSDIPIGIFAGVLDDPDDDHSRYIDPLAKMASSNADSATRERGSGRVLPAVDFYREALAAQPDGSVTIISVGFLNNLHDLLEHERELVAAKVAKLVQMGGVRNDGFNLVRHNLVRQTQSVLEHWPGPIVISQAGADIQTGAELRRAPLGNPVREAYRLWWRGEVRNRSSWDQVAVLYGVRGLGDLFHEVAQGEGRLRNGFTWTMRRGHRTYLRLRVGTQRMAEIIEALMTAPPSASAPSQSSNRTEASVASPGLA